MCLVVQTRVAGASKVRALQWNKYGGWVSNTDDNASFNFNHMFIQCTDAHLFTESKRVPYLFYSLQGAGYVQDETGILHALSAT